MNDEQLFKASFDELSIVMLDAVKNNAMLKAQAEFYINKYNELVEENRKLVDENEQLKEDLRKLEGELDPHTTEENK